MANTQQRTNVTKEITRIYRQEVVFVWRYLQKLGVASRDLEDCVHEIFVVLFKNWKKYDATRPIRPWLCGIASNVASDYRRRASNRRERLTGDGEDTIRDAAQSATGDLEMTHSPGDGNPEARLELDSLRHLILTALNTLSEQQRKVFVLHDIEGFSIPEIVMSLDISESTLYSQLRLGRKKFVAAFRQQQAIRGER